MKRKELEVILWSIALPGIGQILNKQIFKGTFFITLEFFINVQSNFNHAIMYSFLGEINKAIEVTNYQWLMFYPCLYMFAIWDAYKHARGTRSSCSFFPFVFSAYCATVGVMYSSSLTILSILLGHVFCR